MTKTETAEQLAKKLWAVGLGCVLGHPMKHDEKISDSDMKEYLAVAHHVLDLLERQREAASRAVGTASPHQGASPYAIMLRELPLVVEP